MRNISSALILIIALALPALNAYAFSPDSYTSASALSQGRWVKVSVATTGIHFIPAATLRSWGFPDPEKIAVHGYGAARLPDRLSRAGYIDDVPRIQTLATTQGVYFYAVGPVSWTTLGSQYHHSLNPYTQLGYYFITQTDAQAPAIPPEGFPELKWTPQTTFTERLYHEQDLVSIGHTGHMLFGEDFRTSRTRTFTFDLPGIVDGTGVWIRSSFAAAVSARSQVSYTVDGAGTPVTASLSPLTAYTYGSRATIATTVPAKGEKLTLTATFQPQGVVTAAHLDAITVNYTRRLELHKGYLQFTLPSPTATLASATTSTEVWDVTDPLSVKRMQTIPSDPGAISWSSTYTGTRSYEAFTPGQCSLPSPVYIGTVENQNLHDIPAEMPDMVIFTPRDWAGEAERLAQFHRTDPADPLIVQVVLQDQVFNEFSSGSPDAYAFRHYLKMVHDRGVAAGHPLKYALMFGRTSFDNRSLTAEMKALREPFMPSWQTDDGLSKVDSFTSDDPLAMLDDDSGLILASSDISIAIGRAPIRNLTNAKTFVDKVIAYSTAAPRSDWKNQVVMMADNGDLGVFMNDSERQYRAFTDTPGGSDMFYTKVYIDAFDVIGGECTGGRQRLHRKLDEGILWWNYIGHGALSTLAEENVMTNMDINSMYNRRWPVLFAATCSFAKHDGPTPSGSETMLLTPGAGVIAAIAPTRESMISHNGTIAEAMGATAFCRDADGRLYTIGQILQRAKRRMLASTSRDANNQKLYYPLLGDPALRLAHPDPTVVLEQIDGQEVNDENQCTLMARQRVRLTGSVYDPSGKLMDDFDGILSLALYDAEYSTTSHGANTGGSKPTEGLPVTFEEQGAKLYVGRDSIRAGRFDVTISMPSEVADNFRPAALNMYAYSESTGREAIGCNRQFYVYGYDDSADPDTDAPKIEYAYLNHDSFLPGSTVNESPMFLAAVSDDVAINLSTAGIGHQMTLKLDDSRTFTDVALYYTPAADGSPSGTVAYPVDNLTQGHHTLTFRVWDTSGNPASKTLAFYVEPGALPKIFDIYTDVNPASTHANFYLTHNRPDSRLTVSLDIYDMMGHRVWTTTVTDRSDMFLSAPITWQLTDMAGRRVQRGIYIYRATITTESGHKVYSTAKRLAVTTG